MQKLVRRMWPNKFNIFAGNPLDRLHGLRDDDQKIQTIQNTPTSLFVSFHHFKPLVTKPSQDQKRKIVWKDRSSVEHLLPNDTNVKGSVVLLGEKDSQYYLAFDS